MATKRASGSKPATPEKGKKAGLAHKGYDELLRQLKDRIRTAQLRAALAVNHELVMLYWQIGRDILNRQKHEGWGTKVIDRLPGDLRRAYPDMTGLSPRNLKYMRAFAEAWPEESIVQQVAAQIPWFHNCVLIRTPTILSSSRWPKTPKSVRCKKGCWSTSRSSWLS